MMCMTTTYFVAYDSDIDSDYHPTADLEYAIALALRWQAADWYVELSAEAAYCNIAVYALVGEPWTDDEDWCLWDHLAEVEAVA